MAQRTDLSPFFDFPKTILARDPTNPQYPRLFCERVQPGSSSSLIYLDSLIGTGANAAVYTCRHLNGKNLEAIECLCRISRDGDEELNMIQINEDYRRIFWPRHLAGIKAHLELSHSAPELVTKMLSTAALNVADTTKFPWLPMTSIPIRVPGGLTGCILEHSAHVSTRLLALYVF